jgi:hypothetical protein
MKVVSDDDDTLRRAISKNETLAEWGGAAVVFGLIVEVVLTSTFRHGESFFEAWGPVLADALIALGVFAEILFARKARMGSEALQRQSDEKIAEANARAAEAALKIEQLRVRVGPRRIDESALTESLKDVGKLPVEIMYTKEDGDSYKLSNQLGTVLAKLGWEVEGTPIPPNIIGKLSDFPSAMAVGGQPTGIAVVMDSAAVSFEDVVKDKPTPVHVFSMALRRSIVGDVVGVLSSVNAPKPGIIRVVISPRP